MNPVEEQTDAYNAHDIERFLSCYRLTQCLQTSTGRSSCRGSMTCAPSTARTFVIDEERVTGRESEMREVAIYDSDGGRIDRDVF
jgi:hypothetical protein